MRSISKQVGSTSKYYSASARSRTNRQGFSTYRAHTFSHFESMHDYTEPSAAKHSYGEFIFDLGELGGGIEDTHVVKFRQQLGFHFNPEWVLSREKGQPVYI
jgi:hypothetical protein